MLRAQRFFNDRDRALVERLGVAVAALVTIKPREVAQRLANVRMVGTQRFFEDRDRTLGERFGAALAALVPIQPCEVI